MNKNIGEATEELSDYEINMAKFKFYFTFVSSCDRQKQKSQSQVR